MSSRESQLQGVDPSGVYTEPEDMEADDATFQVPVAGSPVDRQPQPQGPQNLTRFFQEQLLAQVQGNLAGTGQQGGSTPNFENQPGGEMPPNITVNHTYNIHYQSDRPSPENARDIAAYGQELVRKINEETLEQTNFVSDLSMNVFEPPSEQIYQKLDDIKYYNGDSGIKDEAQKYIPDAKYRNHSSRYHHGRDIQLNQLHENIRLRDGETQCRHTLLVGNPGSGKTTLIKRYARMVMNHEVPALEGIEAVHFINVPSLGNRQPQIPAKMLLNRLLPQATENTCKFGYEWVVQNCNKILFIFDNADKVVAKFKDIQERINHSSESDIHVVIENIMTNNLYRGVRTLFATREMPMRDLNANQRFDRTVRVGVLSDPDKVTLTRSIAPGYQGEEFIALLERRYPGAFSLSDDVVHLYSAIICLQYDRCDIKSDTMLIMGILQCWLRSRNISDKIVDQIPRMKKFAFHMMEKQKIVFDKCTKEQLDKELILSEMYDLLFVTPYKKNYATFRILSSDLRYSFHHKIIQEVLAAGCIADMDISTFKSFVSSKIHQPHWCIVRRFLYSFVMNKDLKDLLMYYVSYEGRKASQAYADCLKESMKEQLKKIDQLASPDRLELLSTVQASGEGLQSMIPNHIHNICLPDVVLEPSDIYIIGEIEKHTRQLHSVDLCISKDVNDQELEELVVTVMKKVLSSFKLDIARLLITDELIDSLKNGFSTDRNLVNKHVKQTEKPLQVELYVNSNTSTRQVNALRNIQTVTITIKQQNVPDSEVATKPKSGSKKACGVM